MASPPRLHVARLIRNDVLNIGPFTGVSGTATEVATRRRKVVRYTASDLAAMITDVGLCQTSVNPQYIMARIPENDTFFLMFYEFANKTFEVVGFIMAKTNIDTEDLYIDVICSAPRTQAYKEHSGALLIQEAIAVARRQKLRSITLSSLPHVLTYYPRFKFAHRKSCSDPANVSLPEVIVRRMKGEPGTTPLPSRPMNAYKDDDMLNFMTRLHERGYGTVYKGPCALDRTGKITKDKFRRGQCASDGFKMMHCL